MGRRTIHLLVDCDDVVGKLKSSARTQDGLVWASDGKITPRRPGSRSLNRLSTHRSAQPGSSVVDPPFSSRWEPLILSQALKQR